MSRGGAAAAPSPDDGPGIGIDLIEVARLERVLERRPGIAERVFRPAELEYARAKPRPARHLAARFAAKEAAFKALGAGELSEFEVVAGAPPALRLHGRAAAAARGLGVSLRVSLTHSRDLAAAVVRADPPNEA